MSFWSDQSWSSLPAGREPVQPYDPQALEDANYLLSIGDEIYVSSPETKSTIQRLTDEQPHFAMEPGQFAFLLTAERETVPFDAIGFISIRASIKFMGLVNISGFHVDPGYSGKLIFAVFNAGPTRIHLKKGEKVFPLWLASLDKPIKRQTLKHGYESIPPKLVTQIAGDFTTAYQVKVQLDEIKADVTKLKAFRIYLLAFVGVMLAILLPTIKERVQAVFLSPPAISKVTAEKTVATPPASKPEGPPKPP